MHLKKNLKNHLQKYRVWKKLTQEELSKKLKISVSELKLIERQKVTPQFLNRWQIIQFFGVSMDQMFYKDEAE